MRKEKGFTLMEILIAVLIILILIAICLPIYFKIVEKARGVEITKAFKDIRESALRYKTSKGNFTNDFSALDLSYRDANGQIIQGNIAELRYFQLVFSYEGKTLTATRNAEVVPYGRYVLNMDIETGKTTIKCPDLPPNETAQCDKLLGE